MLTDLKVPRQCPVTIMVKVRSRQGKALGREESKLMESRLP